MLCYRATDLLVLWIASSEIPVTKNCTIYKWKSFCILYVNRIDIIKCVNFMCHECNLFLFAQYDTWLRTHIELICRFHNNIKWKEQDYILSITKKNTWNMLVSLVYSVLFLGTNTKTERYFLVAKDTTIGCLKEVPQPFWYFSTCTTTEDPLKTLEEVLMQTSVDVKTWRPNDVFNS